MSKAFVCDKCGKVILLDDDKLYYTPEHGISHLVCGGKCELDLCEDCVQELMAAVRDMREGATHD